MINMQQYQLTILSNTQPLSGRYQSACKQSNADHFEITPNEIKWKNAGFLAKD